MNIETVKELIETIRIAVSPQETTPATIAS